MKIPDVELVKPEVVAATNEFSEELAKHRLTMPNVVTQGDCERTTEEVREKKTLKQKIEKFYEPYKSEAYKAHRATCAHESAVLQPLIVSITVDERRIGQYLHEQERKRLDEQARLQAETDAAFNKQIEKREKQLVKAGKDDEAKELKQAAEMNRPVVSIPDVAKPNGVRAPVIEYDFQIINSELVPRQFCDPSETKIRAMVKMAGLTTDIPGVRVFKKEPKASVR